jgi:hypothetical protein
MLPLRLVEKDHDDFEEPIVELWREDEFVGYVFWDEDTPVVQVFLDAEGDPFDLDLRDFQRILEMADQIVSPDMFSEDELADLRGRVQAAQEGGEPATDVVELLTAEFDDEAAYRNEDGEGFYPKKIAAAIVERCNELDMAVVEMEGFDYENRTLIPRPNLNLLVRGQPGDMWSVFRPEANLRAAQALGEWPSRSTLVVAFVIQLNDGESIVL